MMLFLQKSTTMINQENENSFEEEDENLAAVNEDPVTGNDTPDEVYEDNSAQQRQIDDASRASEPSFTLDPDKGIPEGPEQPDRLFDYDGEADEEG
jgi:hypothetical protein